MFCTIGFLISKNVDLAIGIMILGNLIVKNTRNFNVIIVIFLNTWWWQYWHRWRWNQKFSDLLPYKGWPKKITPLKNCNNFVVGEYFLFKIYTPIQKYFCTFVPNFIKTFNRTKVMVIQIKKLKFPTKPTYNDLSFQVNVSHGHLIKRWQVIYSGLPMKI